MTMKRMFGMLTTSKWMKVISIITVASMLLTLTACGGTASQKDAAVTTESNSTMPQQPGAPEEPNQDIDDGADISEPTEDPNPSTGEPSSTEESPSDNGTVENPPTGGAYTYTVYGQTISMDINVDDYIKSTDWGDFFLLAEMAYSLGWAGNDIYTTADTSDPTTYSSQWYARHDGDMTTRIDLGYYNEEQIPDTNNGHQFRILDLTYLANGGVTFSGLHQLILVRTQWSHHLGPIRITSTQSMTAP